MTGRVGSAAACAAHVTLFAAACTPGNDAFETQHLVVRADAEICAGTLASFDEETSRISQALGLEWSSPIRLGFGESLVAEACVGTTEIAEVAGCARGFGADTEVFADLFSSSHELVHGLRRLHGFRGPPFFSEGIAELVGARGPLSAQVLVVDPNALARGPAALAFDAEVSVEHYRVGAHFLAWLSDREGTGSVIAFMRDPAFELEPPDPVAVADAFRDHFGDELATADQDWRDAASVRYDVDRWCAEDRWLDPGLAQIVVDATFDCSAADTLGPPGLHHLPWCLSLPDPETFMVDVDSDELDITIGLIGCPEGAGTGPPFRDKFIDAGTVPRAFEFGACEWWIRVGNPRARPGPYRVTLTRD